MFEWWREKIESSDLNRYRTRRQILFMGVCHIFDGLVILATLGKYRGWAGTQASVDLLRNAMNLRKAEEKAHAEKTI